MPANALLQSLELTGIDIGTFSTSITDYAAWVPSTTTSTTVTAAAASTGATVTIDPADDDTGTAGHQISLATGKNAITVTVTNGTLTKTYTAVITRSTAATLSDKADLAALAIADSDVDVSNSAVTEYTANVPNSASSPTVTATGDDTNAIITIDPADADTGTTGHQVSLAEGANTITIAVEATDGTTKTYTITVNRASSADFGWDPTSDIHALLTSTSRDPWGLWSDGTTMWLADWRDEKLYAYDLATGARKPTSDINTLDDAGNHHPTGLWSDGTIMWVADSWVEKLYAYDLATGARKPTSDINTLDDAGNNSAMGLWSDGTTIWVADKVDDYIYAYDLATGARQPDLDLGTLAAAGNQDPVGIWSDGATMWVADGEGQKLYAYDLATGARQSDLDFDTLAAEGNQDPRGIWSNGSTMWVADDDNYRIYAYNMPANALLQSLGFTGIDIGFSPGRQSYAVRVPSTTTSTTVTADAAFTGATVAIVPADTDTGTAGHQISLATGDNTVTFTVTERHPHQDLHRGHHPNHLRDPV